MVLQLVSELTRGEYDMDATIIQQGIPLPNFNKSNLNIPLEEVKCRRQDS